MCAEIFPLRPLCFKRMCVAALTRGVTTSGWRQRKQRGHSNVHLERKGRKGAQRTRRKRNGRCVLKGSTKHKRLPSPPLPRVTVGLSRAGSFNCEPFERALDLGLCPGRCDRITDFPAIAFRRPPMLFFPEPLTLEPLLRHGYCPDPTHTSPVVIVLKPRAPHPPPSAAPPAPPAVARR